MNQPVAPVSSTARMLARGMTRRCPRCGSGRLFTRWFHMVGRCPRCGYRFAREEGFFLGAFVISFGVTCISVALVMGVMIAVLASGGSAGAIAVTAVAAVLVAVVLPIAFYPFSKTIWAAIDVAMHRGETWAGYDSGSGAP